MWGGGSTLNPYGGMVIVLLPFVCGSFVSLPLFSRPISFSSLISQCNLNGVDISTP